jgi:hypothetical protein
MQDDSVPTRHRAPPLTEEQRRQLDSAKEAVARAKTSVAMFCFMIKEVDTIRERVRTMSFDPSYAANAR